MSNGRTVEEHRDAAIAVSEAWREAARQLNGCYYGRSRRKGLDALDNARRMQREFDAAFSTAKVSVKRKRGTNEQGPTKVEGDSRAGGVDAG